MVHLVNAGTFREDFEDGNFDGWLPALQEKRAGETRPFPVMSN